MATLPHVDEHAVATGAPPEAVWQSLIDVLDRTLRGHHTFARVLGAEPAAGDRFDGELGQTLTGFRVVESTPGSSLTLEGRHRFAHYRLAFRIEPGRVIARTDAAFPGVAGRLYRAAVIGSGSHRYLARYLLRRIAAGATR